ncbi:tuftelin-interacting protein 11 isoform X1 [Diorhabda carinulata]|uniref:tuftelin-interacting protein 11 isoform X1 n=1 Tax=Diorhabda carinulata TaxID=1163345 RepID=UPI0025A296A0|nr:tuftelin-interacting protein 11 isoform X1 [Diorhabda carinulata]
MSDDEMEKFEITDYDLENEFNINRTRKKQSKHHQIYGIWADDSDGEDDKKSFKYKKQPKNYSAPIGFVAGGVHQVGKKKDDEKKTTKMDEDSEEVETKQSFKLRDSSDESEDEIPTRAGCIFLFFKIYFPNFIVFSGFGISNNKKSIQSTVTEINTDIAGMRTKSTVNQSLINKGVGHWEKHTKGIGAKLLLQMGFQPGKGLGKDLQGISAPVEAHLRKGRGAIGAYGPEKSASIPKMMDNTLKMEIENETDETKGESKWKKTESLSKKSRYYYRSVDDVIEKGKRPGAYRNLGNASELSKVKVIDMTGPQQRVLSGYHALSGLKAPPGVEHFEDVIHKKCSNFALPEIQHNLDLLVDMCEQDIIRIDRNTRFNEDRIIALEQEEKSLKEALRKEDVLLNNLKNVRNIVDKLMDTSQTYSLGQIADIFKQLQEDHREEYELYELGELAPGLIGPLLTSALANWNPLIHPHQYTDVYGQWKEILERRFHQRGNLEGNKMGIQPYDNLIWHTWMPVMRTCVSSWNPRDCDSLITLIDIWKPLLPQWILENVFTHLIMPRILKEVNNWNPVTDTIPIHVWIHPWIPLLDEKLQTSVYPVIQEKLGNALTNWHPSDRSAKLMLQPWQRVLSQGSFVAFLLKHIVPKLQICMQSLVINPHQQHLDPWNWVMDWSDMISVGNMTLILDKFFFPRWLQTLAMWLNHNPNYTQVTEWYSGWKRMLSDELINQPTIKEHFHNALEMMNRAVNVDQPGAKESILYLKNMEENGIKAPPVTQPRVETIAEAVKTASKIPQGFKDLVMKKCEERGMLFVPIPNKYHEAKQVYKIGSNGMQCYIDRNVIFYSQNFSAWVPTSLNKLLDSA